MSMLTAHSARECLQKTNVFQTHFQLSLRWKLLDLQVCLLSLLTQGKARSVYLCLSTLLPNPDPARILQVQLQSNATRSLGWVRMASFLLSERPVSLGSTTGLALCCTGSGTGTQCQIFCVSQALILLATLKGFSCSLLLKTFLLVWKISEVGCPWK